MDTLTHGLFGLAVGALRRPDAATNAGLRPFSPTDRAVLLGCLIASELPDLDYLLPAADAVTATLRSHRGLSHSLVAAPAVALVAAVIAKLSFRSARFAPVYLQSVLAVVFAHLLPDLWTGWGTRLLLPFSDQRLSLDWTGVIDPIVTLPMLVGAVWAWRARRIGWRRPMLVGLAVTAGYLGLRIGLSRVLSSKVEATYGTPAGRVFPDTLGVLRWRYVVPTADGYAAGAVTLRGTTEQRRTTVDPALLSSIRDLAAAREVLAWARWPVASESKAPDGTRTVTIGDLRYHQGGEPTLRFVLTVDPGGTLVDARLDRGGSFRELFARWRAASPR